MRRLLPALHLWCVEAHRREVERQAKHAKKKAAQRARSGQPTDAGWTRLKNLTMAEWQRPWLRWLTISRHR
jgi:hypothetical protein